jgi:hypothetical protein
MIAPGSHHIDLPLDSSQRLCNRLRFETKPTKDCPDSYAYANVRLIPKDRKTTAKSVWIACDVGDKTPAKHGPGECITYRAASPDGWATFDLSLPEEVQNSPFGEEGLEFSELLGIRLRGSISVSPIELYA